MKFSIIIPARNEEAYLAKTLKSIENQNYPEYETIVVANGCVDNTVAVAKKYADHVYSIKKPGVSRARNLGAKKAKGEILVFLDADTTIHPSALKVIKSQFSQKYSSGTLKVKPDKPKLKYQLMMGFKNLVNTFNLYHWTAGIIYCRQSDFQKTQGFNENLHVRENSFFVKHLKKYGRFQFLRNTHVTTAMRRFDKCGAFSIIWFYISKWFKGPKNIEKDKYPLVR
ncbi:glycosyltransferase [Nanoarchaeota archaeon]